MSGPIDAGIGANPVDAPAPACPRCGVAVPPHWDWCQACGFDPNGLAPSTWVAPGAMPPPPPPPVAPQWGWSPPPMAPPPGVWMPPPQGPPPTSDGKIPVAVLAVGVGVLAVVVVCILAVTLLGHTDSSSNTATDIAGASSSSTATVGPSAFAQQYVAAAAMSDTANTNFVNQLHVAEATPCTCPAGSFDSSTVLPLLPPLAAAYQAELTQVEAIQTDAPAAAAADFQVLITAQAQRLNDLEVVVNLGLKADPSVAQPAFAQYVSDRTTAADAAAKVRADLGLPPN
jgi:hypothetical protein